jgi:hypothetical protein
MPSNKDASNIKKLFSRSRGKIDAPKVQTGLQGVSRSRGSINTNRYQDWRWTPKNTFLLTIFGGIPYFTAVIATYLSGMKFIALVLLGGGLLILLTLGLLRIIDRL